MLASSTRSQARQVRTKELAWMLQHKSPARYGTRVIAGRQMASSCGKLWRSASVLFAVILRNIQTTTAAPPNESEAAEGVQNATLLGYVEDGQLWSSRGAWYTISKWGARTNNCAANNSTTVCMACSQNMPDYAAKMGVVPLAVGNQLWFDPARAAVCSMCLKVYITQGDPSKCNGDYRNDPNCPGQGSQSYQNGVTQPWAYSAKLTYDPDKGLSYFTGVVIEWYDRNQSDPLSISYPVQGLDTDKFGTWPIEYEGTPCPVGGDSLAYQFLDNSKPFPGYQPTNQSAWTDSGTSAGVDPSVASSLCDNELGKPCGGIINDTGTAPLNFIKFQVIGQRIPLSAVQLLLQDGHWHDTHLSGDGYWQASGLSFTQDPDEPVSVRIFCSDGSTPKTEEGLYPRDLLCAYQDPTCQPKQGTIQC